MAIKWFCGFETGDQIENTDAAVPGSIQTTTVRTGTYALRINPTAGNVQYFLAYTKDADGMTAVSMDITTLFLSFYFRYATKPSSGREVFTDIYAGGVPKATLYLNSSGQIELANTGGTTVGTSSALTADTWYLLQVKVGTGNSSAYELNIDGTTSFSGTTNFSATTTSSRSVFIN